MIYTDGVHLISDTSTDELHEFAQKIGLRREWYQDHSRHPHYDLLSKKVKARALRAGAKLIDRKTLVKVLKKKER